MPFKTFNNWIFDGNLKSEIPDKENLLKYNSPITVTYVINMFILNAKLNYYLNEYFNNIGLRYLDKEEFFRFIKKCVHDFKVQRKSIPFIQNYRRNSQLFEKFRKKIPMIKSYDISLLCDLVDKSKDKDVIYSSLGLDKVEKHKVRKSQQKKIGKKLDEFLDNFKIMRIDSKK